MCTWSNLKSVSRSPSLLGVVALAVACGSQSGSSPAPGPVSFTVGVYTVTVAPGTANLSVLGPASAPLLPGLDSSTAAGTPWSMNDDAPPMTGFAVRDLSTTYK